MTNYERALLQALEAESARRQPQATDRPPATPDELLALAHDGGQREAVADDSPTAAWITTRRAGKTRGAVIKALRVALRTPNVNVLYLNTTIKRAVNTFWGELLEVADAAGIVKRKRAGQKRRDEDGDANGSRHVLRLPNGSQIWVSGCETKTEADAWRGVLPRTALVIIDEGQDWRADLLAYVYGSVVIPSLADIGGAFLLMGTPSAPRGFFFEFHKAPGVSFKSWSLFANPWVKNARELLETAMRVRGCDENDPSIRREFFAEFAQDSQRQIFPWNEARNAYDPSELPSRWDWVIVSADFGTVDATAVCVWGVCQTSPHLWLISAEQRTNLGAGGQIAFINETIRRYPDVPKAVVGDPGAGTAQMVDLRQLHGVPIASADKQGKVAAAIQMRDGLRSGLIKVPRGAKAFIDDLQVPEWDPEKPGEALRVGLHWPDQIDSALYGFRRALALHRYAPAVELTPVQKELQTMIARHQAQAQQLRNLGIS